MVIQNKTDKKTNTESMNVVGSTKFVQICTKSSKKPKFFELKCEDCGNYFGAIFGIQGPLVYSGTAVCRECGWRRFVDARK